MRVQIFQEFPQNIMQHLSWQALMWSASGNFWESRLRKALRHGAHAVLLTLIALSLLTVWPRKATVSDRAVASTPIAGVAPGTWVEKIIAAHLFGQAQQKRVVTATKGSSVTVDGIAAASDPNASVAILTLNGKTNEFHVDEVLPDGEKLVAIDPDSVELADGSNIRRIALATYEPPDSEGSAAYAALLHGVGLSSHNNNQQNPPGAYAEAGTADNPAQPLPFLPASIPNRAPLPAAGIVNISPQATPLEQLQTLRAQLIHR